MASLVTTTVAGTLTASSTIQVSRSSASPLFQVTDADAVGGAKSRWFGLVDGTSRFAIYGTNGTTEEFKLESGGVATFSGALTGTSATFTGNGSFGGSNATTARLFVRGGYTDFWNSTNTLLRVQHTGTEATLQTYTNGGWGVISLNPGGGNVGIGTTNPGYLLDVNGTARLGALTGTSATFSGLLSLGGTGSLGSVTTNQKILANFDGGYSTNNSAQNKVIGFIGTTVSSVDVFDSSYGTNGELQKNFYLGLSTGNSYFNNAKFVIVQGGVERFNMAQGGNSTFNQALTVSGITNLNGTSTNFGGGYGSTGVSISNTGNIQANGTLTVDGALTGTSATLTGNLNFTAAADRGVYFNTTSGVVSYIRSLAGSGEVEIGSDNRILFTETDADSPKGNFDLNSGKFRIGDGNTPAQTLEVNGNIVCGGGAAKIETRMTSGYPGIEFSDQVGGTSGDLHWCIGGDDRGSTGADGQNAFVFRCRTDGTRFTNNWYQEGSEVLTIDDSGQVGMSYATPSERLCVNGNVGIGVTNSGGYKLYVNGTTNLNGALTGTSATFSGDITTNSTTHAYVVINSSAANRASWLWHKQGTNGRWLAGVEGSETRYQLYSTVAGSTGVKFALDTSGNGIFSGDMTIADDFYFKATDAWIIAGSVAGGALTGGILRIQNFGELEVDGVLDINGAGTSTFASDISSPAFWYRPSSSAVHCWQPKDGYYHAGGNVHTGAIRITLPPIHDAMVSFWVDVYDYAGNESFSAYITGYPYLTGGLPSWSYTSAVIVGGVNRNFTVRFGDNNLGGSSTDYYIYIGETNSTWNHPQVVVRDVFSGYATSAADWEGGDTGWGVSFATSFENVAQTQSNTLPYGDYNKLINTPTLSFLPLSGGTMTGDITFNDNVKAKFGTGSDLEIYHNGSHSFIKNTTGQLRLQTDAFLVYNEAGNENIIWGAANGTVELYYNSSKKLETTNVGVTVTGILNVDVVNNGANSANIIYRGASSDTIVGGGTVPDKLYVYDTGNVGIGTATVNQKLVVKGKANEDSYITADVTTTGYTAALLLRNAGNDKWLIKNDGGSSHAFVLYNFTATEDAITVTASTSTVEISNGDLLPRLNNSQKLGNTSRRWNFYANTGDFGGSIYVRGGIKDDGGDFGTNGQVLTTNGVDQVNWQTVSSGSGTVTSVTAGTGMTQSGTSTVNPTLNVIGGTGITANANDIALTAAGAGSGSHGSTSNSTKIDTITLDAYGRVTAVATGATGSGNGTVTSVATTGAITGGTITSSGTIAHSTSAGYKHVPTAGAAGQFLKYSSSGTATWVGHVLDMNNYLHIAQRYDAGTSTGGALSGGQWNTRTLNATIQNNYSGTQFGYLGTGGSANRIILKAGTYYARVWAIAYDIDEQQINLANLSQGSALLIVAPMSTKSTPSTTGMTTMAQGMFTIANNDESVVAYQWANTAETNTYGGGRALGSGTAGPDWSDYDYDTFVSVEIWKLA